MADEKQSCKTCRFVKPYGPYLRCTRYAPRSTVERPDVAVWPHVAVNMSCGEYEAKVSE